MAEFCVKCFNELNGTDYKEKDLWTDIDFCEGCGEWKPCIVELRPKPLLWCIIDLFRPKYKGTD